ncbi:MAG: hypothetical protein AAGI24_17260 [Pseudomonadota bacterium]
MEQQISNREHHVELTGRCRCGAVDFRLRAPAAELVPRRCGCDYCTPGGYTYLGGPGSELKVNLYQPQWIYIHCFGTRTADFVHCAACNTLMYVLCRVDGREYGLAVANVIADADLLPERQLQADGESLQERLQRRSLSWIPNPEIVRHVSD